jgi:UDP-N-acetylmuramoyl-L-alanyl-D-glutamate--2,6-diaminopimelate ligase
VRLHELLDGFDIIETRNDRDVDIRRVAQHTRDVVSETLFCCIPGEQHDGHDYAVAAVGAGAAACLVGRWVDVDVPQFRVASVRAAVGPIASRILGDPSRRMLVFGITGTNGKTTITYLLEQIAHAHGEIPGIIGTTGAFNLGQPVPLHHTTPEATDLQRLLEQMWREDVEMVAMEVSSHALDQYRVDGTRFAAACFTNLSHDHLDYHGTIEAYFEAKARLFTRAFTDRAAICIDDSHGRVLVERARAEGLIVATYGVATDADFAATDVELGPTGTSFTLVHDGARTSVQTTLVGAFNVKNALGAIATAHAGGYRVDWSIGTLARPISVPGRMERIDAGQQFTVLVDYAHTPDALASVLRAARPLAADGKLLVVFGCGGDRDRAKRPVMGEVATRMSDRAYLTNDNPRSEDPEQIARDVLRGVSMQPVVELDRRVAIRAALHDAKPGDVVVIAGKGHESGQTARGVTLPFDDRVVAREELEALA